VQAEAAVELAEAALEQAAAERELAEAAPEQAAARELAEAGALGAAEQLIVRMAKPSWPALGAWSGMTRIKGAWLGTAVCCLAPELTEHAFALVEPPSGEKLALLKTVACLGL
jgi:hypothetical protein